MPQRKKEIPHSCLLFATKKPNAAHKTILCGAARFFVIVYGILQHSLLYPLFTIKTLFYARQ